jgi:thiol-disulfide isomerase/thioredoxin
MKRYLLILSLVAWTLMSAAQIPMPGEFVLSGEIKDSKEKLVYLFYTNKKGTRVRDSCRVQSNQFSFKGSINGPALALLRISTQVVEVGKDKNIAEIFLEPVNMIANMTYDHFDEMTLKGSKTNDEYTAYMKEHKLINSTYSDSLYERHSNLSEEFIFNHSDSYVSAHELALYRGRWAKNTVQYLYMRLNAAVQKSVDGMDIKAFLDGLDANAEGRRVHDFMANDVQGKMLKSADFKGRYVLLDFWGSWCVPCRESTPHLIELFKKYSGKGFAVIGIATENEQTGVKWRDAIKKDGTGIWYHVLSNPLPGSPAQFTKDIAGMFGVHVFPTKILIDPCGFIIGRFSGTDEDAKLDELLKEIYN